MNEDSGYSLDDSWELNPVPTKTYECRVDILVVGERVFPTSQPVGTSFRSFVYDVMALYVASLRVLLNKFYCIVF